MDEPENDEYHNLLQFLRKELFAGNGDISGV